MTDADPVSFKVEGRIAWVNFNRPEKRNCMSPALNRRMMEVLDELEFREDVGVLVLGGEGTAWSAGTDLKEYFRETEAEGLRGVRRSQRESYGWFRRLRWYQKPTIAMVNGWCFGGGYAPLFACDLAICADEARFGLSEVNWGILPGGGVPRSRLSSAHTGAMCGVWWKRSIAYPLTVCPTAWMTRGAWENLRKPQSPICPRRRAESII